MTHPGSTLFGKRMMRREDRALLRGEGRFIADISRPDACAMHVLRSSEAHARLLRIDTEAACRMPGCVTILTGADLPPGLGPLPCLDVLADSRPAFQTVLAQGRVRYVGEPVAVVVAEDAFCAEDIAEQIAVTYEKLPVQRDGVESASSADLLYPEFGSNLVHETRQLVGDPQAGFEAAALLLEENFRFHRVLACPMETRGVLAEIEPGSARLVLWSSTQIPQGARMFLATMLGLPPERLRVVAPLLGGGFGLKEALYPEEALALLATRATGRPVRWIEDRREHLRAAVQAREEVISVRAAVTKEGIFTGLEAECLSDIGAAYALVGNTPGAAIASLRGPYRIANFRARARSVVTNKPPLNVYRGAGLPQAVLAMERLMDLAAAHLGLDRAEIRRRNLLCANELPIDRGVSYPGAEQIIFDSGDFPATLERTLEAIGYADFPARRSAHEREHATRLGIGLSFLVEMTATGPYEPARVSLLADGRVRLSSGITVMGQGTETTLVQIMADALGLPPEQIEIANGDSDEIPDAIGTFASRGAAAGGNAARMAAGGFAQAAIDLAAECLNEPAGRLRWQDGGILRADRANAILTLPDLIELGSQRGIDVLQRLDSRSRFDIPQTAYANACHAAIVEIDPASGQVAVLDYAVTHDCGKLANPMLVDGQIMGGVMQGIGATLSEALCLDDAGQPLSTGLLTYVLPSAAQVPRFHLRHIETPSPLNPLGMKGAGESGFTGAPGALVNAIADALAADGLHPTDSGPYTPDRVLDLLQGRVSTPPSLFTL